jgi:maleate isomerase
MPAATTPVRVGLLLPSTNVTIETELPVLLARHQTARFTIHSSRLRLHAGAQDPLQDLPLLTRNRVARLTVYGSRIPSSSGTQDALRTVHQQRQQCVAELLDASCQVLLDGCLGALPAQQAGAHRRVLAAIQEQVRTADPAPVAITSAEAVLEALQALSAQRIAVVLPSPVPLAEQVVAYLSDEGLEVTAWAALDEADSAAVACIEGSRILAALRMLDLTHSEALVVSADGQMPSLPLIELAEVEFGVPVVSAVTAAAFVLLRRLHLPTVLPHAGELLEQDR